MTTFLLVVLVILISSCAVMVFMIRDRNTQIKTKDARIKQVQQSLRSDQAQYKMKLDGVNKLLIQANETNQQHLDDLVKAHKKELGHYKSANTKLSNKLKEAQLSLKEQIKICSKYKEAQDAAKAEPITSDTDADTVDDILSNG